MLVFAMQRSNSDSVQEAYALLITESIKLLTEESGTIWPIRIRSQKVMETRISMLYN